MMNAHPGPAGGRGHSGGGCGKACSIPCTFQTSGGVSFRRQREHAEHQSRPSARAPGRIGCPSQGPSRGGATRLRPVPLADADYPLLDIDGTPTQLNDFRTHAEPSQGCAGVAYVLDLPAEIIPTSMPAVGIPRAISLPHQTVWGTFSRLAANGRSIVKMQPFPGMLRTWMSPAFARTAWRAIASPSPRPERSAPRRSPKG